MTMKYHISGLVPAVFTPMNSDGSLNVDFIPPVTNRLITQGIGGVYVCGSTGEGPSLTKEERTIVTEAYIEAVAGRVPVIVQVGHNSLRSAGELAAHAQKAGADAISAVPPSYFRPNSLDVLIDSLAEITSQASELPFYYYNIPSLSRVNFDIVRMLELSEERLPSLVGIKYSALTLYEFQACLAVDSGRYNMLFGSDEMLLSGLATGAHGAVGSTYNFAAPVYNQVIDAFQRGDIDSAREWQSRAVQMVLLINQYGGNPAIKAMMKLIDLDCGPVRLPQKMLTEVEIDGLRRDMEGIGFFEWAYPSSEVLR
jgi:N-acetylneuraminate lyase